MARPRNYKWRNGKKVYKSYHQGQPFLKNGKMVRYIYYIDKDTGQATGQRKLVPYEKQSRRKRTRRGS